MTYSLLEKRKEAPGDLKEESSKKPRISDAPSGEARTAEDARRSTRNRQTAPDKDARNMNSNEGRPAAKPRSGKSKGSRGAKQSKQRNAKKPDAETDEDEDDDDEIKPLDLDPVFEKEALSRTKLRKNREFNPFGAKDGETELSIPIYDEQVSSETLSVSLH